MRHTVLQIKEVGSYTDGNDDSEEGLSNNT